ncbi:MAG: radical SAM protein [Gemmatimonadota bacterium]
MGEARGITLPGPDSRPAPEIPIAPGVDIPHVIAWNLTRRCNLACAHCYISAGAWHGSEEELSTAECLRVVDQILAANPSPMLILSGGEPLVRDDLEDIVAHAARAGATVVVGTNGIGLTTERILSLKAAGVQGVAVSIDSLDPVYHDRFRHGAGALTQTLAAVDRLREHRLDFIVQTTVTRGNKGELEALADWAAGAGAVSLNVYFLVETGRAEGMPGLPPAENEAVLAQLLELGERFQGRMMVRSKCQPQIMRHAYQAGSGSSLLNYGTRCPCGVQYCRITPDGKVTPCPYLPEVAGDLRQSTFSDIWYKSDLFGQIRSGNLGGKCGRCEYREVCGGCRARAFASSGDVLGADESCVYEPEGWQEAIRPPAAATYGAGAASVSLAWTPEAEARMARIPSFVRTVVMKRMESFAREQGRDLITEQMLDEVRTQMPVDFSKRRPFFLRDKS